MYKLKNDPESINIIMGTIKTGKSAYLDALNAAQESGQRMGYAKGRDETAREISQELRKSVRNMAGIFIEDGTYVLDYHEVLRTIKFICSKHGSELED